ncbi:MAG: NAD(P)/FAD-dependent oxidoreductase [Cytophagales bacterium]
MKKELSFNIPASNLPRLVIIGGGFAGIELVKHLKKSDFQIVLLDRHNYHTFQPLLYQVATAGLEPDSIAGPLRKLFKRQKNVFFRMASVDQVDHDRKEIHTSIGELRYDYIVFAHGTVTNYFGNDKLKENSFPLKQIPQALDLRSNILQNLEKAVLVNDLNQRQALMNFVIVGGGPTGVEVAGALGELKLHVLPRDFPELDLRSMQIHLVEGTDRLLGGMSEQAGEKAKKYLGKFEVQVWLKKMVKEYDGIEVKFDSGEQILTKNLIWAAGVTGNVLAGIPESSLGKGNRLIVDDYSNVKGLKNAYAIGDIAIMQTKDFPEGHPQQAPVAIQQAKNLATNLSKIQRGKTPKRFKYNDRGSMATVGRNRAVVDLKFWKFQGAFAWLVWMFVHLMSIYSVRNRFVTLMNWMWNYFTYDRGARLIIRPFVPNKNKDEKSAELEKL